MPYSYHATALALGTGWEPIYSNTVPDTIALVRLVFNAPGAGGNLWVKLTTSTTEYAVIGGTAGLAVSGGRLLAGYPAIALTTGESLMGKSTGGIVATCDIGVRAGIVTPPVAPIRQAIGTSWTAITSAASLGSRLVSHQQIANSTATNITVQLRLNGITGNPVVIGGGSLPLTVPANTAAVTIPDLGIPPGATLQAIASASGLTFLGIANDRP